MSIASYSIYISYISNLIHSRNENTNTYHPIRDIAAHSNGKWILALYEDNRIVAYDVSINETITTINTGEVKPTVSLCFCTSYVKL